MLIGFFVVVACHTCICNAAIAHIWVLLLLLLLLLVYPFNSHFPHESSWVSWLTLASSSSSMCCRIKPQRLAALDILQTGCLSGHPTIYGKALNSLQNTCHMKLNNVNGVQQFINSPHSNGNLRAIWDHTVLPDTWHR